MAAPVAIRRHAILKQQYRRAVALTPDFQDLDLGRQWALLRDQVLVDSTPAGARLLDIFNSRQPRQAQVIAALEEARLERARTLPN